jgi:hypothetical protein
MAISKICSKVGKRRWKGGKGMIKTASRTEVEMGEREGEVVDWLCEM